MIIGSNLVPRKFVEELSKWSAIYFHMIQSVISDIRNILDSFKKLCFMWTLFSSSVFENKDKGHLSHFPIGLKQQQCLLDHSKLKCEHDCLEL